MIRSIDKKPSLRSPQAIHVLLGLDRGPRRASVGVGCLQGECSVSFKQPFGFVSSLEQQ